jgi:hypothetical protein
MQHKSDKVATARCSKKIHQWLLGIVVESRQKRNLACSYSIFKKELKFNVAFCAHGAIEWREVFSGVLLPPKFWIIGKSLLGCAIDLSAK